MGGWIVSVIPVFKSTSLNPGNKTVSKPTSHKVLTDTFRSTGRNRMLGSTSKMLIVMQCIIFSFSLDTNDS